MTLDVKAAGDTLQGLKPFPVAVTTTSAGRTNGLMSLSAAAGGIIPEAPRVTISITKYNFTHDLVADSGVFAVHLLSSEANLIGRSIEILMRLGGASGRDGDKLSGFRTEPGVTTSPILQDALSYVEGRVVGSLDAEENTIFLADVVAAGRLHEGRRLTIGEAWGRLPATWIETYERNHHPQLDDCRRRRGLVP